MQLVPPKILVALRQRLQLTFAETPFLFFGVVIGVAIVFKLGIGYAREASLPKETVPTFATTASLSDPPAPAASAAPTFAADPAAVPLEGRAATATGAAAAPMPARVPPRPRGHGRRTPHSG